MQSDPTICRLEDNAAIELDLNPDVHAYLSAYVTNNPTKDLAEFVYEHQAQIRLNS